MSYPRRRSVQVGRSWMIHVRLSCAFDPCQEFGTTQFTAAMTGDHGIRFGHYMRHQWRTYVEVRGSDGLLELQPEILLLGLCQERQGRNWLGRISDRALQQCLVVAQHAPDSLGLK